uniref:Cytoplasmic dynein intermediate chain putative n=1 Tax=Albugo laibachii Nc14 TaxID=890382 RepID=F0WRJ5_9STRA|nr:cytoplasmic dynein intermediate chain putative [Albugo laibachii Nc14]|eukprot:CCA23958.1 cytoplasmic dynein intermediate chain putative [Albugo laibachii Nc14]
MEDRRARHAAELEAKRKKLKEIRQRKENLRTEEITTAAFIPPQEECKHFDDFIESILKTSEDNKHANDSKIPPETPINDTNNASASLAEKLANLSTHYNVAEVHMQPAIVETYGKHAQTDITLEHELCIQNEVKASPSPTINLANKSAEITQQENTHSKQTETHSEKRNGLSEDEKSKLMESEKMEEFLLKTSRIIERALAQTSEFDIMVDYSAPIGVDDSTEETAEALKQQFLLRDARWTRYRAVTDLDVSLFFSELLLASYSSREFLEQSDANASHQWDSLLSQVESTEKLDLAEITEGLLLLWSTALPTRPEYRFTCHAQVTSACFNPFDRHIIFGGTYSGQIVVWDTRAKNTPVQKTSMSTSSHTHPIYSMSVIGSKTSHNLISASTDGRVCIWDTDQLQQPVDVFDMRIALSIVSNYTSNTIADKKMEASVTAFAVHQGDKKDLYIGTEAGKLFVTCIEHQKMKSDTMDSTTTDTETSFSSKMATNSNANPSIREVIIDPISRDTSHSGPITAMHFHPLLTSHREGLLLSSSMDSTVKLWSTERLQAPILSFEPSNDYICDVKWSSTHASLFAVVDSSGKLTVWNVCKDVEMPLLEANVSERALNKVAWTLNGKSLIIGDADGNTFIYDVPSEITLLHGDEVALLEKKIASLC